MFHGNRPTMQQDYESLRRLNMGRIVIKPLPGWVIALATLSVALAGVVLFIVSASVLLVLAPIFIGLGLYLRWRFLKTLRAASERTQETETIIETDYRVHDDTRHNRPQ